MDATSQATGDPAAETPANGGAGSPFDAYAASYDDHFTDSVIGRHMRRAVWRAIDPAIETGVRVLELGCGTGADAIHLAGRGATVLATDASAGMARTAARNVRRSGFDRVVDVRHLPIERAAELTSEGPFDVALSNFGALNCIDDLGAVRKPLARLLRPGGRAFLCIMGPWVPWEWLWFLLHGQPRSAFRRFKPGGVTWRGLRVVYPSIRRARRKLAPDFRARSCRAVGTLVPPSYVEPWAARRTGLIARLDRIERRLESTFPLPWLADHYLLELERTP